MTRIDPHFPAPRLADGAGVTAPARQRRAMPWRGQLAAVLLALNGAWFPAAPAQAQIQPQMQPQMQQQIPEASAVVGDIAQRAIHVCASCHGDGGRSKVAAYPALAGQSAQYLVRQLKDFRSQQRAETDPQAYMWGVSALLDDATIQALADHYAEQKPLAGHASARPSVLAAGKRIFETGIPTRGVRACASCHGDQAEGAAAFPRLAGQHAAYLERQLTVFGTRLRPHGVLMKNETASMTRAELKAVAAYLQSL